MIKEKNTIAKIFEVERRQVLVTRSKIVGSSRHSIKLETEINDRRVGRNYSYSSEKERNEAFDSFDIIQAASFFKGMQKLLE